MTKLQEKFLELSPRFEALAMEEYRQHKGRLLRCNYLGGYVGNTDDSDIYNCDAIVKVIETDRQSILHWNDEWLDPYWDVEIVHWISKPLDLRSVWFDGPSHNLLTGERVDNHVKPISRMEYMKLKLFGKGKGKPYDSPC